MRGEAPDEGARRAFEAETGVSLAKGGPLRYLGTWAGVDYHRNVWRERVLYKEGVDLVLRPYVKILQAIFHELCVEHSKVCMCVQNFALRHL